VSTLQPLPCPFHLPSNALVTPNGLQGLQDTVLRENEKIQGNILAKIEKIQRNNPTKG
jgi:hypothetical protein